MRCHICGTEMTNAIVVWVCTNCRHTQFLDAVVDHLHDNVDEIFYHDAFDFLYPLLAHEYHVLYTFIINKNYYGALLEYKDVVEILLKFPTLIAINHFWRKRNDEYDLSEKSDEKAIMMLLSKRGGLSLGDWEAICQKFIDLHKKARKESNTTQSDSDIYTYLTPLLEAVFKLYKQGQNERKNVVTWRNEVIGHGALQSNLETDSVLIKEFNERIIN